MSAVVRDLGGHKRISTLCWTLIRQAATVVTEIDTLDQELRTVTGKLERRRTLRRRMDLARSLGRSVDRIGVMKKKA